MRARLKRSFAQMTWMGRRLVTQTDYADVLMLTGVLLTTLVNVPLAWPAIAETINAPTSNTAEQAPEFPRRGILTLMSNLRASPSTQSKIVTIAKEGTAVEILTETERWYRVRNAGGVEGWIYKPLVLVEPELLKEPTAKPAASAQSDLEGTLSASALKPDVAVEPQPDNTQEPRDQDIAPVAPIAEPHASSPAIGGGWVIDAILPHAQSLGAYIITALVVVLVLSIALQLRAARQLRRAMQEMGQILDIVEEIVADGDSTRTRGGGTPPIPLPVESPANRHQRPVNEGSPVERVVLDAISDHREVQEGELGKILEEKGFPGVLIKAVVGDIVRKTATAGLPWVEVRYTQGRYSYRLRPEAIASPGEPQAERP